MDAPGLVSGRWLRWKKIGKWHLGLLRFQKPVDNWRPALIYATLKGQTDNFEPLKRGLRKTMFDSKPEVYAHRGIIFVWKISWTNEGRRKTDAWNWSGHVCAAISRVKCTHRMVARWVEEIRFVIMRCRKRKERMRKMSQSDMTVTATAEVFHLWRCPAQLALVMIIIG